MSDLATRLEFAAQMLFDFWETEDDKDTKYDLGKAREWVLEAAAVLRSQVSEPTPDELASVACATPIPQGFAESPPPDGRDGERIGTNIATWAQWRDFFAAMLTAALESRCPRCGGKIVPVAAPTTAKENAP